ncbi:spore coat putative kinase YutH [Evansella sp. AB-rgal1]|uniref:spore coat putative kinase YutH n=1 Tax=Evansella sp. AB-rgal1 TaxID=3242696 RepID=UPI00359DB6F9
MLERAMFDQLRIYPEEVMNIGDDVIILSEGNCYLLRELDDRRLQKISEQQHMTEYLSYKGERDIATFLQDDKNKIKGIHVDGKNYAVFTVHIYHHLGETVNAASLGKRLALFHQRGIGYSEYNRDIGKNMTSWKDRWEKRLDQLEQWYMGIVREKNQKTDVDKEFCITYPYFMGICENAIQMMMDISLDDPQLFQNPYHTICHYRFHDQTWLTLQEEITSNVKVPTDFVYDHITRDISDYMRMIWIEYEGNETAQREIIHFLTEYESVYRLTLTDQKLLFIRLLFPLHYFDHVERYYNTGENAAIASKCMLIFQNKMEYERLLDYLLERYPMLKNQVVLPAWINK